MLMLHFPVYSSKINNWEYSFLNSKLPKLLLKLAGDGKKTQQHMQNSKWEDTAELEGGHLDVKVSTGYLVSQYL